MDAVAPALVVLNGLSTTSTSFISSPTFRMTNRWISELDYCVLSPEAVNCVVDFVIDQQASLPSNHAPIMLRLNYPRLQTLAGVNPQLQERAFQLSEVAYSVPSVSSRRRQIQYSDINQTEFIQRVQMSAPPDLSAVPGDVDQIMDSINTQLTGCALHSLRKCQGHVVI